MNLVARSLVAAAFVGLAASAPAAAQADLDCWQFASWADAQAAHEAHPWTNLDDDWDGIACECLYYGYPCWTPYR